MAISNIYNSLTFGGVSSADYGIYITGEAVYNAPKRVVDMVDVPGRNGAIAIDQGRWENIEIEYPAGTFGMTEAEFRTAVSNFRNAICSQIGYQRLTDTYHPDEYRMALYVEGLEVEPEPKKKAGEFTLKFDAKPQRWLTEGETAVTVSDGDTLTNPTPYDAGPLLMVEGYGTIGFNGYEVEIRDAAVGNIELLRDRQVKVQDPQTTPATISSNFSIALMNNGDDITLSGFSVFFSVSTLDSATTVQEVYFDTGITGFSLRSGGVGTTKADITITLDDLAFAAGQGASATKECDILIRVRDGNGATGILGVDLVFAYDITTSGTTVSVSESVQCDTASSGAFTNGLYLNQGTFNGNSTMNLNGHPTYIDCELGEAYKIEQDEIVSLNTYIAFGSDLPVLKSGSNEITFDNTVTELKVKPNWWKL